MRRALRAIAAVTLVAPVAGCGGAPGTRPFDPRRRLTAAQYDLSLDGRPLGHVKVWTRATLDADRLLEVHLRLRNDTTAPMRLDAAGARLEVRTESDPLLIIAGPVRVDGAPEVPPGGMQRVALAFELPPRAHPAEVTGYELLWSLETVAGRLSRTTTFAGERGEDDEGYRYYPSTLPFFGFQDLVPIPGGQLGPRRDFYDTWR